MSVIYITMNTLMDAILSQPIRPDQAALWALGEAGYLLRSGGKTVVIDPYLSDSVGAANADFKRVFPTPVPPEELRVDIYIVTHDHLDHLDQETIRPYRHKSTTRFVAPRLACRTLRELGIPGWSIVKLDSGEETAIDGVAIRGVYAVPTEPKVIDTAGYRVTFPNGRNVNHTADTAWSPLLMQTLPQAEVLLVCINGKWGNLGVAEAVELTVRLSPRYAIPMHYDLMALNSENPQSFAYFMRAKNLAVQVRILKPSEPFIWSR